ncbi:4-alpha-glucanotransferase, partial [Streptococcus oralis]
FFKQWFALKDYANQQGIYLIGDIPIYVASDSAEVWQTPHYFKLNQSGQPQVVAGCPPDAFSADGQLWGNPIYDWEAVAKDNYQWWIKRIQA